MTLIAWTVNQRSLLELVLGVWMILNLVIAGLGQSIPLLLDRFGTDTATSAAILITTATDVLGYFFFLGLAKVILDI